MLAPESVAAMRTDQLTEDQRVGLLVGQPLQFQRHRLGRVAGSFDDRDVDVGVEPTQPRRGRHPARDATDDHDPTDRGGASTRGGHRDAPALAASIVATSSFVISIIAT